MDYEKKYKEALKKAEAFYYSATTEPITEREVLANIFPELKESEDEMIRKEIIDYIKHIDGQTIPDKQYDSWLAWLKKQGEKKHTWSEEDEEISKGILNYLCLHDACELEGFDDWYEWLKDIKYRVQSKQEWSKEDERMRQYVVSDLKFIKELANDPRYVINVQLIEKEIEWMKSIKNLKKE